LTVRGIQGHAAYPELADNPIHRVLPHLARLAAHRFDAGSPDFAPTSLQITELASGVGASNVIPGGLTARFNIRFGPIQTPEQLEATIRTILDPMGPDHYTLTMALSGLPFRTEGGQLLTLLRQAIRQVTGREPELSTGGGTSDARFLARRCPQTVEFGLVGSTMHQVNESCGVAQLELLTKIYTDLFQRLFGTNQDQG
jgi:succinyl-diaminopimelate desuccinylase